MKTECLSDNFLFSSTLTLNHTAVSVVVHVGDIVDDHKLIIFMCLRGAKK